MMSGTGDTFMPGTVEMENRTLDHGKEMNVGQEDLKETSENCPLPEVPGEPWSIGRRIPDDVREDLERKRREIFWEFYQNTAYARHEFLERRRVLYRSESVNEPEGNEENDDLEDGWVSVGEYKPVDEPGDDGENEGLEDSWVSVGEYTCRPLKRPFKDPFNSTVLADVRAIKHAEWLSWPHVAEYRDDFFQAYGLSSDDAWVNMGMFSPDLLHILDIRGSLHDEPGWRVPGGQRKKAYIMRLIDELIAVVPRTEQDKRKELFGDQGPLKEKFDEVNRLYTSVYKSFPRC